LADIYDTPSLTDSNDYAHHTHLSWEPHVNSLPVVSPLWRGRPEVRLKGVDVTSKTFTGNGPRELVRRYALEYESPSQQDFFRPRSSYLTKVTTYGRCDGPVAEQSDGTLPSTPCAPSLPATSIRYVQSFPVPPAQLAPVHTSLPKPIDWLSSDG